MASSNRGKQFELRFRTDWTESIPGSFIFRLNDNTAGYFGISSPCDFIGYKKPDIFLLEVKSHQGNTFPFSAFRQYEQLLTYSNIDGLHAGVILWLIDHDKVLWIPVETFKKLKDENKKSFNIKFTRDEYEYLELPSKKLRTFMKTDYSALIDYYKGKDNVNS